MKIINPLPLTFTALPMTILRAVPHDPGHTIDPMAREERTVVQIGDMMHRACGDETDEQFRARIRRRWTTRTT